MPRLFQVDADMEHNSTEMLQFSNTLFLFYLRPARWLAPWGNLLISNRWSDTSLKMSQKSRSRSISNRYLSLIPLLLAVSNSCSLVSGNQIRHTNSQRAMGSDLWCARSRLESWFRRLHIKSSGNTGSSMPWRRPMYLCRRHTVSAKMTALLEHRFTSWNFWMGGLSKIQPCQTPHPPKGLRCKCWYLARGMNADRWLGGAMPFGH